MNDYTELAIRERINTLEAEHIRIERSLEVYQPRRIDVENKAANVAREIEDLREDLGRYDHGHDRRHRELIKKESLISEMVKLIPDAN